MASPLKNVLLIGGAGTLGPSIIKALLEAGTFKVSALSRPSSKSTFAPEVKKLSSDFTSASLVESFKGQDVVIDLVAQSTPDIRKTWIDAAVEAGVKRFIPSEFSGNMLNENNLATVSFFKDRITVRDYLQAKADANPSFSYTPVSTGPFYDWAIKAAFIGFSLEKKSATIYGDGNTPTSMTTLSTVGKAVAGILSHPAETANKNVFINSFVLTQNEVLAILEEATGSKWTTNTISTADALARGYEALGKGDMGGIVDLLMASTYGAKNGNDFSKNATLSNDLFGLPKEDLKAVTKAIVEGKEV